MISTTFLSYFVILVNLIIIATILFGLRKSLIQAHWQQPERLKIILIVAFILVAWFVIALTLSWFGFFQSATDRFPTIELGAFIPVILGLLVLWFSKTMQRILKAVPQKWLVAIQAYRIFGGIFLVLYAFRQIPGAFALPAGIGDFLVGLFAPIVAFLYSRRHKNSRILVLVSSLFGIVDLIVAVTTGFLTSPSRFQLLSLNHPNELISSFPLVMIPVFAVPIFLLFHFFSLIKLGEKKASF